MIRTLALALLAAVAARDLPAQIPPDLAAERAAFTEWLTSAPNSPLAAIAHQRLGRGIRLGPADADIPLPGLADHRLSPEGGRLVLEGSDGRRTIPRGRVTRVGRFALEVDGTAGEETVTVFGRVDRRLPPGYYDYNDELVFVGQLVPPTQPARLRLLASDGRETEAAEAGTVRVPIGGRVVPLVVRRIPTGDGEESELEIFFRDATSGRGSYPAGRFVSLIPVGPRRYRLDFNRARNPFCAYSSVYPCPAPWRGNTIAVPVAAGERYRGGQAGGRESPSSKNPGR